MHILYTYNKSCVIHCKKYHLAARPNKHGQNRNWYAWWWEPDGKGNKTGIFRSTGERLQVEAEGVLKTWEKEKELQASGTMGDFALTFFIPGQCQYLAWKAEQGGLKTHTVYEHRKNREQYILPQFGNSLLAELSPVVIENWLRGLALSGVPRTALLTHST